MKSKAIPSKNSKQWVAEGIKAYAMLMVEFLRLSPSYTLAGELFRSELSEKQRIERVVDLYRKVTKSNELDIDTLWQDFQSVLATYEQFGDVISRDFKIWWKEIGLELFGAEETRPKISVLSKTQSNKTSQAEITQRIFNFAKQAATSSQLIVAIPLGLTKSKQLAMLSKILDQYPSDLKPPAARSPRPFAAQRLRDAPLRKSIGVLWARAMNPTMPLWQIGVICKVSEKYSSQIAKFDAKLTDKNFDVRNSLTILTHRMFTRGQLIAENAAHGIFPSHSKKILPLFDLDSAYERMIIYRPNLRKKNQEIDKKS